MVSLTHGATLMLFAALDPMTAAQAREAEPAIRTDRYTLAAITPTRAQSNPLDAVIEIAFSPEIDSVGGALKEVLADTGYTLNETQGVTTTLYQQSLAGVHTHLGPIAVHQALQVLIGSAWQVDVDPILRVVSPYLVAQHHLRAADLEHQAHRPLVTEGASHYVAFPLGNTDAPVPAGQRLLLRVGKAFLKGDPANTQRLTITGLSHSQGTTATQALALGRAEYVRRQLMDAGIPKNRMVLDTDVMHRSPKTRAGATITVMSQVEAQPTTPSSLTRTRLAYLQIEAGSLRTAVERVVGEHGYQIAGWHVEPISIEVGFAIRNQTIDSALNDLLQTYPVSAQIIRNTNKIVVTGRP